MEDDVGDLRILERQPTNRKSRDFVIRTPAWHPSSLTALRSMTGEPC
jgi:hypothetical protein